MDDRRRSAKTAQDYTVAIVCAIEFEMSAVRYMFDEEHLRMPNAHGDPNNYILGNMCGHNVVLTCLPGNQGKSAAAIVATNLDRTFPRIKWRFLTGNGGGVPSDQHDIRLGDVVVSMSDGANCGVVQYDLGKDTDAGFKLKGFLTATPPRLRAAVSSMRSDHQLNDNRIEEFVTVMLQRGRKLNVYRRPSAESDVLFRADYTHRAEQPTCNECDQTNIIARPPREYGGPQIHYGLIASGDRVMRNAVQRDRYVANFGDILCFEMEAAGVMSELPYIVIRGISNYADSHKNDAWQHYAAAAAAACTKEFLTYLEPEVRVDKVPARLMLPQGQYIHSTFTGREVRNTDTGNFPVGGTMHIVQLHD